jgi:flagellar biosynthesis protein FlhB
MSEQSGDKSFEATPHRRQQAREKGQVAYSQDLGSALLLLVSAGLLQGFGSRIVGASFDVLKHQLGVVPALASHGPTLFGQTLGQFQTIALTLLPMLLLLALAAVAASVLQTGPMFVPERLTPDISRISPLKGLGRLFSMQGTARLGFGLLKVLIVSTVALSVIYIHRHPVLAAAELSIEQIGILVVDLSIAVLLWVGLALAVLALADFAFQKWKHDQDLRMTHQEIREEMKNLQGDPQIIARRRQVQRQMVLNRMSGAVPTADVIVTNPTELAVAIKYDYEKMRAPVVVAKGAGVLAQRIRRLALENGIPIVERKPLAQLLYREVEINHPIPDGSYGAVAEVLAYVYQLKGKKLPGQDRRAG